MNKFYKNNILPKLYFPLFYFILILLRIYKTFLVNTKKKEKSRLIISAGLRGWDSIEFKELYYSACEYLNEKQVIKHSAIDSTKYYEDLHRIVMEYNPTHVLYDPRSGDQNLFSGTIEAIKITFLFTKKNIIPIVLSTDLSYRKWRIKSALVSALSGVVICFVSSKKIFPIFPHKRLFGPMLMPLSIKTFNSLNCLKQNLNNLEKKKAVFIGSLYEPRTTKLTKIKNGLNKIDLDLEIKGRVLGSPRKSDNEYWSTMVNAPIVFTTSDQVSSNDFDWSWIQNLVYRYIEVLSCGSLLIAPKVPGVDKYFQSGIHYVSFDTTEEAIEKITYYLNNDDSRTQIADRGKKIAKSLTNSKIFWTLVDNSLSTQSMK
jgi:hypothetical protein